MGVNVSDLIFQTCVFKTPKQIRLYDWRVFFLYNTLLLMIMGSIVVNDIIAAKGYQGKDTAFGIVQPKVNGVARAANGQVWDTWDVVIPPKEKGCLTLTSNYNLAPKQKRGVCSGSDLKTETQEVGECKKGKATRYGFQTGNLGIEKNGLQMCEVEAWCPTPKYSLPREENVLDDVANWTVTMRADVIFAKYDVRVSTAPGPAGPVSGLNMFTVPEILNKANTSWAEVKEGGCIILIQLLFNCNLDLGEDKCVPEFNFIRVDDSDDGLNGFNFRMARYFMEDDEYQRDLYQLFGIRLLFDVGGTGRKTDMNALVQKLGAAAGLLAVAIIMVDKFLEFAAPMLFGTHQWWKDVKYDELPTEELDALEEHKPLTGHHAQAPVAYIAPTDIDESKIPI